MMSNSPNNQGKTTAPGGWRIYTALGVLQGMLGIGVALSGGSGGAALALTIALIGGVTLAFAGMLLLSWMRPERFAGIVARIFTWLEHKNAWGGAVLVSLFLLLGGAYTAMLTPEIGEPVARAYFERLAPLAIWFSGLSLQTLAALFLYRGYKEGFDKQKLRSSSKIFILFLLILGTLLIGWNWVVQNRYASESQLTGWNDPGVPLTELQVLLAWLIGMGVFAVEAKWGAAKKGKAEGSRERRIDLMIGVLLWLSAVILWTSIPITPNWFLTAPRQPNFEYYPNSDALSYDTSAQGLIAGNGLHFVNTPYIRRPLHAIYLTYLHLLAGQDYERLVFLQILVLAFLPVLLYALTKATARLQSRAAAVIAAGLLILREANAIAIAGTITASHVKLLMTDLPAALGTLCYLYAFVVWLQTLQDEQKQNHSTSEGKDKGAGPARLGVAPLLVGGLLGIPTLIRPELGLMLVGSLAILLLALYRRPKVFLQNSLLVVLGLSLALAPWVWRNWRLTGLIFLDSPSFRFEIISKRYKTSEELFSPEIEDNSQDAEPQTEEGAPPPAPKVAPLAPNLAPGVQDPLPTPTPQTTETVPHTGYATSVIQQTVDFVQQNGGEVLGFVTAHSLNSELQVVLGLPAAVRIDSLASFLGHRKIDRLWEECCSLAGYARRLPFWRVLVWQGELPQQSLLPLAVNLFLITLGLVQAWRRGRWAGLAPMLLAGEHILVNAVFRNSGGRYVLPVSWVGLLYFSIGLAQVSQWGLGLFKKAAPETEIDAAFPNSEARPGKAPLWRRPSFYALAVGIVLAGALLPLTESRFPPRYTEAVRSAMLQTFLQSEALSPEQSADLQTFLANGGQALAGRALYPRYYAAETGETGSKVLRAKAYPRMSFYLSTPDFGRLLAMPVESRPPAFPNAVDVLVIACPGVKAPDVLAVGLFEDGKLQGLLARSPLPENYACPLPPMEKKKEK